MIEQSSDIRWHLYYVPSNDWTVWTSATTTPVLHTRYWLNSSDIRDYNTCTIYLVTTEQSFDIRDYNTCATYLVLIEQFWHQRLQHLYYVPGLDWTVLTSETTTPILCTWWLNRVLTSETTCTMYLVMTEQFWHQRLQHLYYIPGNDWTEFWH